MGEEHPLFDVDELVKRIDTYWHYHLHGRALNPHMPRDSAGMNAFRPGDYYINKGYDYWVIFPDPVTEERIITLNQAGYWENQNFIVRLYSLLDGYDVVGSNMSIQDHLAGHEDVDILRRLRNKFAHSAGFYDDSDSDHRQLRSRIVAYFNLKEDWPVTSSMFPIPIDGVLEPLTDGCRRYVRLLHRHRKKLKGLVEE